MEYLVTGTALIFIMGNLNKDKIKGVKRNERKACKDKLKKGEVILKDKIKGVQKKERTVCNEKIKGVQKKRTQSL